MKTETFKLPDAELIYYPDFIETEKADFLYEHLLNSIPWKQQNIKLFGREIPQPRLTAFFAEKGISYTYSGLQLQSNSFLSEIQKLKEKVEKISKNQGPRGKPTRYELENTFQKSRGKPA
jgi:hypothetical protein